MIGLKAMVSKIEWNRELAFTYGRLHAVAPGLRRLVCPNPGPFTLHGTGTYVVGRGRVVIVDPGPAQSEHVEALLRELGDETIEAIVVTHTHRDHSPAAAILAARTGAPTYGFGPHCTDITQREALWASGADVDFTPDRPLTDGAELYAGGTRMLAVHTPGHCANHLCFRLPDQGLMLSGDHVMAWSTSVVIPPDGDMADYMASLKRVRDLPETRLVPTHGPTVEHGPRFVQQLIDHREQREAQLLESLKGGPASIPALVPRVYGELPEGLHGAAAASLMAHAVHLLQRDLVRCEGPAQLDGVWYLSR